MRQNAACSPPRSASLGTKERANDAAHGCDNFSETSVTGASSVGAADTFGVHTDPQDAYISSLTTASEPKTSMTAPMLAAACQ